MTHTTEMLAKALYTLNKHAKTALDSRQLYRIKQEVITLLLKQGEAKKLGLHFSPNPGKAKQRRDVLVQVAEYYFHITPTKEDNQNLPHLGHRDEGFSNPKSGIGLPMAKRICLEYLEQNGKPIQFETTMKQKNRAGQAMDKYSPMRRYEQPSKDSRRRVDNTRRTTSTWVNRSY